MSMVRIISIPVAADHEAQQFLVIHLHPLKVQNNFDFLETTTFIVMNQLLPFK